MCAEGVRRRAMPMLMSMSSRTRVGHLALLLAMLVSPRVAHAQLTATPYVGVQGEYNSNVLSVSSRQQSIVESGGSERSDRDVRYRAGILVNEKFGRQEIYASGEGRRIDYDRLSNLDHDEYLYGAGLKWMIVDRLTGHVDLRQERRMAPFADRLSSQLTLERDRVASGDAKLALGSDWSIKAALRNHQLDSPIDAVPDFALSETAATLSSNYSGFGKLEVGVLGEYVDGKYRGGPDPDRFKQLTYDLTAEYTVSGLSSLDAKLGYTTRSDHGPAGGSLSGYTGSFGYQRKFSIKTDARVQAFRRVSSYAAAASSIIETGATAQMNWRPTERIALALDYSWVRSVFKASTATGAESNPASNQGRSDRYQLTALKLSYRPFDRLWLLAYGNYADRRSSIDVDGYNAGIAGLEARFALGHIPTTMPGSQ